jgi:hypothetical protein
MRAEKVALQNATRTKFLEEKLAEAEKENSSLKEEIAELKKELENKKYKKPYKKLEE